MLSLMVLCQVILGQTVHEIQIETNEAMDLNCSVLGGGGLVYRCID